MTKMGMRRDPLKKRPYIRRTKRPPYYKMIKIPPKPKKTPVPRAGVVPSVSPISIPRKILVKQLDTVFSRFIRLRYATLDLPSNELFATCVTCGVVKHWKEMDCGHYEGRGHFGTRWDERNCNVQCKRCNIFMKGNYTVYALYMVRTYGPEVLEQLALKANSSPGFTRYELQLMIDDYTMRVDKLLKAC